MGSTDHMQELTYLIAQREEARQRLDWNRSQAEEYAERAKADKDEIQMLDVWIGRFDDGTNASTATGHPKNGWDV